MREIKFRAWDKADGLHRDYDCMSYFTTKNFLNGDYDVLMQYTGLKDKNGVEIYEGDIVKQSDDLGREVVMYEGCWILKNHYALYDYNKVNIEVIGNIYENPELLEAT